MRSKVSFRWPVMQPGQIGRTQMVARIPIIAGDLLSFNFACKVSLLQLRKPLPFDWRADIFAAYNPYRYTYTDASLIAAIQSGTWSSPRTSTFTNDCDSLMVQSGTIPAHIPSDAARIHNFFVKDPHQPDVGEAHFSTSSDPETRQWGLLAPNLRTYHTAMLDPDEDQSAHADYDIDDLDHLRDISLYTSRLNDLQTRKWYGERPRELSKKYWGVMPPESINNQPIWLGQNNRWFGQKTITGTDSHALGELIGLTEGHIGLKIPRRMYTEHGSIQVYVCVRTTPIYREEMHYLDNSDIFSDFRTVFQPPSAVKEPPKEIRWKDLFWGSTDATRAGWHPWGQWYRTQPAFISTQFHDVDTGWQARPTPSDARHLRYNSDYKDIFVTSQAGPIRIFGLHSCQGMRPLGPIEASIRV